MLNSLQGLEKKEKSWLIHQKILTYFKCKLWQILILTQSQQKTPDHMPFDTGVNHIWMHLLLCLSRDQLQLPEMLNDISTTRSLARQPPAKSDFNIVNNYNCISFLGSIFRCSKVSPYALFDHTVAIISKITA